MNEGTTAVPGMDMTQMLIAIGYLLLIVVAAYLLTRFVGARARSTRGGGAQLKIIQQMAFARDKSVMLVKAGTKYLVLGVSNQQVTLLTELDEDELLPFSGDVEAGSFANIFRTILKGKSGGTKRGERGDGD